MFSILCRGRTISAACSRNARLLFGAAVAKIVCHSAFNWVTDMDFSAARRAGMGSGFVMRFSGELELHDGIGRRDSVGNVLQYCQILPAHLARATEPARAPAGRTARRGARLVSSGREGADWGVSCLGSRDRWCCYRSKATQPPGTGHLSGTGCGNANMKRTSRLADQGFVHDYRRLNQSRAVVQ